MLCSFAYSLQGLQAGYLSRSLELLEEAQSANALVVAS